MTDPTASVEPTGDPAPGPGEPQPPEHPPPPEAGAVPPEDAPPPFVRVHPAAFSGLVHHYAAAVLATLVGRIDTRRLFEGAKDLHPPRNQHQLDTRKAKQAAAAERCELEARAAVNTAYQVAVIAASMEIPVPRAILRDVLAPQAQADAEPTQQPSGLWVPGHLKER